jgi:hypothetical protein
VYSVNSCLHESLSMSGCNVEEGEDCHGSSPPLADCKKNVQVSLPPPDTVSYNFVSFPEHFSTKMIGNIPDTWHVLSHSRPRLGVLRTRPPPSHSAKPKTNPNHLDTTLHPIQSQPTQFHCNLIHKTAR